MYNVGARAVFSDETDRGRYVRVLFEDGNFGGEVWDFMEFQYTKEGRFFRFEVQKIFNNKVLADSFMSQLKARLSNKYPKAVIKDMGESLGGYIIYFEGDDNEPNKIRILRSPFHPYYVILDYYNRCIAEEPFGSRRGAGEMMGRQSTDNPTLQEVKQMVVQTA